MGLGISRMLPLQAESSITCSGSGSVTLQISPLPSGPVSVQEREEKSEQPSGWRELSIFEEGRAQCLGH